MSAQALFNTLGAAGASAGDARLQGQQQQAAAQQLALRLASFQRQQQVSEALEQYRAAQLNRQNTLAGRPDYAPGRTYQGADKKWYTDYIDRHSGNILRQEVDAPESNVNLAQRDTDIAQRQRDLETQKGQLAKDLEKSRAAHAMDLAKFKAAHPTARSNAAGATPLAAKRWYETLGGAQVDLQIKSLESMLKSMELTSLGGPEQLYQNGLYVKTQQQLAALYQRADQIMQQALQRAGGGAASTPAPSTGGPIRVKPEDIPAAPAAQ